MAELLAHIFMQTGTPPDEVMQQPEGIRAFMFAAAIKDLSRQHGCPFLSK